MSNTEAASIQRLKWIGRAEGVSLLVLLFIAMPLKYMAGKPEMVKYVGWAHGLLFVLYCGQALMCYFELDWKFKKLVMAVVASFIPFGTFWFERKLKER